MISASLAGMNLRTGDICISLGTSDTLSAVVAHPIPALEGHIFVSPVKGDEYMAMLCFKNGSLMREKILHSTTNGTWVEFQQKLNQRPCGNDGVFGMYYDQMEILPEVQGIFRFDKDGNAVDEWVTLSHFICILFLVQVSNGWRIPRGLFVRFWALSSAEREQCA